MTNKVSWSQSSATSTTSSVWPGGLAFFPEALLAAAEEHRAAARQRLLERFAVHVRQHEHGAAVGVLHDGGHQAVALGEVDVVDVEADS